MTQTDITEQDLIRQDSRALNRVFATIGNQGSGIGTAKDRSVGAEVNPAPFLSQPELMELAKVGVVRTACWLYPQSAGMNWFEYKQGVRKHNLHLIHQYYRDLQDGIGGYSLREAMVEASGLGRETGDGFVLIGVADGRDVSEEIDWQNIHSVSWIKPVSRWQLQPVYAADAKRPIGYRVRLLNDSLPDGSQSYEKIWHRSRVRRFPGIPLSNEALKYRQGYNLSVIESFFNSFLRRESALGASNSMVGNHNLRTLGMSGLSEVVRQDIARQTNTGQEMLVERLATLDYGASVARTVLYDKDTEEIENVAISYNGVHEIIDRLEDSFVADTDIPRAILLNELGKTSLTSGESFRMSQFDLALRVQRWQYQHWLGHLEWFTKLAIAAKDCKAKMPADGFDILFKLNYVADSREEAEVGYLQAQKAEKLTNSKIFTPEEIRGSYVGSSFDPTLNPS